MSIPESKTEREIQSFRPKGIINVRNGYKTPLFVREEGLLFPLEVVEAFNAGKMKGGDDAK